MKVSELTGRSANVLAISPNRERKRRVQQDEGHSADRHADDGEKHDRRKLQADGQRLGDRSDHQQTREYGQNQNDIEHWVLRSESVIAPMEQEPDYAEHSSPKRGRRQFLEALHRRASACDTFFGSYGQRSTSTQTAHKGLRAWQTYRPCRISQ